MTPYLRVFFGNPSNAHSAGRVASEAIERARSEVAALVDVAPSDILFTSGATEANNIAILGLAIGDAQRRKVVVSSIEHASVLGPATYLAKQGFDVKSLPVLENGVVDLELAEKVVDSQTLLVSVQAANNETGVVQPISELAQLAHRKGALLHSDAAQAVGKIEWSPNELGVDLASFSGHKIYGPKGTGALFVATNQIRASIRPIYFGGGQERNLRPGTQNVPAIVGFGRACQLSSELLTAESERTSSLRDSFEAELTRGIPDAWVNGGTAVRLPGTISLTIPGLEADMLQANLTRVCLSGGSACSTWAPEPSHVLSAMGIGRADAESTIRISIGRFTTDGELTTAAEEILDAVRRLRFVNEDRCLAGDPI